LLIFLMPSLPPKRSYSDWLELFFSCVGLLEKYAVLWNAAQFLEDSFGTDRERVMAWGCHYFSNAPVANKPGARLMAGSGFLAGLRLASGSNSPCDSL
jgi:hypothetical protein